MNLFSVCVLGTIPEVKQSHLPLGVVVLKQCDESV